MLLIFWLICTLQYCNAVPDLSENFLISLRHQDHHFCTGTLIKTQWILTAAHCFDRDIILADLEVVHLADIAARSVVSEIFKHPMYDPVKLQNDIALIKVQGALPKEWVLPNLGKLQKCAARSWNPVKQSPWYYLKIVSCFSEELICGCENSGPREEHNLVNSGAPLISESGLNGIESGVRFNGCDSGFQKIFTRVSPYLSWITSTIESK